MCYYDIQIIICTLAAYTDSYFLDSRSNTQPTTKLDSWQRLLTVARLNTLLIMGQPSLSPKMVAVVEEEAVVEEDTTNQYCQIPMDTFFIYILTLMVA